MTYKSGVHLLLKEAFKSYKEKRYQEAIVLLEKITANRPGEPWPYFLLCVTYLHCDRLSDAEIMIKNLRNIAPDYSPLIQLELFLFLKSSTDINPVIAAYLDKLDNFPKDKYINRAIKNIRQIKNFSSFQKSARLSDYVSIPKPGIKVSKYFNDFYENPANIISIRRIKKQNSISPVKIILIIMALCVFTLIGAGAYYYFLMNARINIPVKKDITELDSLNIDILQYDLIDKILNSKPPVFYYSNEEVVTDFNKAKDLIKNKKYNDALLVINKISSSNANYRVKERNEFLRKFIANIEFKDYIDIPLEKVLQKPYLYRGMSVKWKGKIANLRRKDEKLIFNMLIDYKEEDVFSGIIDVFSGKDRKDIKNGDIVTLEGIFINAVGNNNRLYVTADSLTK